MLKRRIALCLALVVGTLTLTNGIIHGARAVTISYRVAISVVVFAIVGYAIGVVLEFFIKKMIVKNKVKSEHINIDLDQQIIDELPNESGFTPFTSDNFQQIPRPKE